jgi:hypothetical protein
VRIGSAVPAPAVGRAWLLLCPSRKEGRARGVCHLLSPSVRQHRCAGRLSPAPRCWISRALEWTVVDGPSTGPAPDEELTSNEKKEEGM